MDKFVKKGVKKLFGLARTKIRLAVENGNVVTRPAPLPLVKRLAGVGVGTVAEAGEYVAGLRDALDFSGERVVASTVFQLLDVIEGVKYGFEPDEAFHLIGVDDLDGVEGRCRSGNAPLNLLLLTSDVPAGVCLFVGDNPPAGVVHLGYVISTLSFFLDYAFHSDYFSGGRDLRNIVVWTGGSNLLASTVGWAVNVYII
jgi:hypothetical protein